MVSKFSSDGDSGGTGEGVSRLLSSSGDSNGSVSVGKFMGSVGIRNIILKSGERERAVLNLYEGCIFFIYRERMLGVSRF